MKIPIRYIPDHLSQRDRTRQKKELLKSRTMYKKGKYHSRPKVHSFRSRKSSHVQRAKEIYRVKTIGATDELARATGCTKKSLAKIIQKGEGAYYSSGSRPNQTAQSWGIARLASAVTGGNSALVDWHELQEGCKGNSEALRFARKALRFAKTKKNKEKQTKTF